MFCFAVLSSLLLAGPDVGPGSPSLAVRTAAGWHEWWQANRAPAQWLAGLPVFEKTMEWRPGRPGVQWGELTLSGDGEAWRVRVIMARFDPRSVEVRMAYEPDRLNRPAKWEVENADADAAIAFNAGQFTGNGPWGWVVRNGVELRAPGAGPLAPAVVVDSAGSMRFVTPDSIAAVRARGNVKLAFQSYPALLQDDGTVPAPLRRAGMGVSLTHRDARLALCERRNGEWLVALTRFEGLGGVLETLPFGLTTPEMAALMGAMGCRNAVLLDGGLSGQLMIQEANGERRTANGLRKVPMGLVVSSKP